MSPPLKLSRAAKRDIDLAFVWCEKQKPGLGDEFLAAVDDCIERIKHHPEMYAIATKDLRVALVSRFPCLIIYRLLPSRVRISAIVHSSRHPRNWKDEG